MRAVILALALAGAPALAAEQGYAVAGFDRIRAAGPFEVRVRVGRPVSVRAVGPRAAIDRLVVESEGGQLTLRPERSGWNDWQRLLGRERMLIEVGVPSLRGVSLAGSGNVSVDRARAPAFVASVAGSGDLSVGTVEADEVRLAVAGSGDLTVAGRAKRASASVAGSGDIIAGGLSAISAEVSVAGSGDVGLTASRTASVSVVGSGDVVVTGNARCTVSKRGSGEVRCGR